MQESTAESTFGDIIRQMKHYPNGEGCSQLGDDGVLRTFGPPPERIVVDAVGLSPSQIKRMLDTQPGPWSQECEDTFRGVDGRKVVDNEALFNPPDQYRPPKWSAEEYAVVQRDIEEYNEKLREKIDKEREEGIDVAAKYACGRKRNDYDLSPRTEMSTTL